MHICSLALLLQDRHGDLGQVVESQVVDGPLLDEADRSFQPVAPEALAVGDANHSLHHRRGEQIGGRGDRTLERVAR